jgi:hypothetical protein
MCCTTKLTITLPKVLCLSFPKLNHWAIVAWLYMGSIGSAGNKKMQVFKRREGLLLGEIINFTPSTYKRVGKLRLDEDCMYF